MLPLPPNWFAFGAVNHLQNERKRMERNNKLKNKEIYSNKQTYLIKSEPVYIPDSKDNSALGWVIIILIIIGVLIELSILL